MRMYGKTIMGFILLCLLLLVPSPVFASPERIIVIDIQPARELHYGDTLTIIVKVLEDGNPVSGVDVGLEIKDPNGVTVVDQVKTSGPDGTAVFTFTVGGLFKAGLRYTVYVSAPGASAVTYFSVTGGKPVGGKVLVNLMPSEAELLAYLALENIGIIIAVLLVFAAFAVRKKLTK